MAVKQELDYVLVPLGLVIMAMYHIWLLHRFIKHPTKTIMGINALNRKIWVRTMMQDQSKNGILSVQTLRNNIMASTLLASMAITMSSLIAILLANGYGNGSGKEKKLVIGDKSEMGFSIKYLCVLVCFLLAFLMNVQSVRYYSHTCILINVPVSPFLSAEFVGTILNKAGYFWSLGLRVIYFSFPLFLWFFGPIPMFLSCLFLVFLLYFLDVAFSSSEKVDFEKEKMREREEEEDGV